MQEKKSFHSLNEFLKSKFGEKVYRVSLDAGFTCPNRDGSINTGGCSYCNEDGARAGYVNPEKSIKEQLLEGMKIIRKKYGAHKFLAYFQAYSNTYAPVDILNNYYQEAINLPEVVGISIGTRPDCIDNKKLELINSLASKKFVIVEYGVQTLNEKTLQLINRGHTACDSIKTIQETLMFPDIHILTHVIFGLPGETIEDMTNTVLELVKLGTHSFKFHHLYVEKGAALENEFLAGKIKLLTMEEYCEILLKLIPYIPPDIVIHRLFGQSPKEKLIAPLWTLNKTGALNYLENQMRIRNIYQGCLL